MTTCDDLTYVPEKRTSLDPEGDEFRTIELARRVTTTINRLPHVMILGQEYQMLWDVHPGDPLLGDGDGLQCGNRHIIVLKDLTEDFPTAVERESALEKLVRHELIHAFLLESGLDANALTYDEAWPLNEEMVDWMALQLPKLLAVCTLLNVL